MSKVLLAALAAALAAGVLAGVMPGAARGATALPQGPAPEAITISAGDLHHD